MAIELFIEKYPVDVNETFSTLLTFAIDDIKDFGSKNTTFTKTIILPGTKKNNKLFGNIYDFSVNNKYHPTDNKINLNSNDAISADAIIIADQLPSC